MDTYQETENNGCGVWVPVSKAKLDARLDNLMGQIRAAERQVTCDQECWVKDRIRTSLKMALQMKKERRVDADDSIFEGALEGLVEGTAVAVIETLGKKPCYINLRSPYRGDRTSPVSLIGTLVTDANKPIIDPQYLARSLQTAINLIETTTKKKVVKMITRFGVFGKFRASSMNTYLDPVTLREVLETGFYGTVWGVRWYVDRKWDENEIRFIDEKEGIVNVWLRPNGTLHKSDSAEFNKAIGFPRPLDKTVDTNPLCEPNIPAPIIADSTKPVFDPTFNPLDHEQHA